MGRQNTDIEKLILKVGINYQLATKDLKILVGKALAGDIKLNCKRSHMYMDETAKQICYGFKGIQRDRIIKILSGTANFQERKMFFMNYFIYIKLMLKRCFKEADNCCYQANECNIKSLEAKIKNRIHVSDKYKKIAKEYLEINYSSMNYVKSAGEFLLIALPECEDLFTDHEIAQIFSCNFNKVKEARNAYDALKKENKVHGSFLFNAIFTFNTENRGDYKGRRDGIQDCPTYEIPFFTAIVLGNIDRIVKR